MSHTTLIPFPALSLPAFHDLRPLVLCELVSPSLCVCVCSQSLNRVRLFATP